MYDISLATTLVKRVVLPGSVANLNVRPAADQVVAADADRARIYRIAMATHKLAAPIDLPSPFVASAPVASLRARPVAPRARGALRTRQEHAGDAHTLDP